MSLPISVSDHVDKWQHKSYSVRLVQSDLYTPAWSTAIQSCLQDNQESHKGIIERCLHRSLTYQTNYLNTNPLLKTQITSIMTILKGLSYSPSPTQSLDFTSKPIWWYPRLSVYIAARNLCPNALVISCRLMSWIAQVSDVANVSRGLLMPQYSPPSSFFVFLVFSSMSYFANQFLLQPLPQIPLPTELVTRCIVCCI